jgi:hypothetical protein
MPPGIHARLLAAYRASSAPDPIGARAQAARSGLLPVYLDIGGWVGLRDDGELLEAAWDSDVAPAPVVDRWLRRTALAVAARDFPELAYLRPQRPEDAVSCPHCGGTGRFAVDGVAMPFVLCPCAGLGWLPPGETGPSFSRGT